MLASDVRDELSGPNLALGILLLQASPGKFRFGSSTLMEAVILIGAPGSGKSSYCRERLFHTHIRISLDLVRTRFRERLLIDACLSTFQRFVVDNTNPSRLERSGYVAAAKAKGFKVRVIYFRSKVDECLRRNASRQGDQRVPDVAILSFAKKLEPPRLDEGFDELLYVGLTENGFREEEWRDVV
ncbi:MAG TPA: AAA family ATPase [Pirellulaceae bacterium]|jgi:predicted kinase|nr:AAA family ATPase [Pirellulaceae bacterium]